MDHPFHPIAEEYPLMPDHDIGRMTQDMVQRGFDPRFPIILFEGKILDGRNRSIAAKEAKVKPLYVQFTGTEEEARWFAMRANEERRHLAQDWLQRRRKERIERVAQRRQEGASTRQIAEEEGVTHTQIQRDLKESGGTGVPTEDRDDGSASGVPPGTPEKVTGRDGKQYSARRPEPVETPQRHPDDDVQQHPDDMSQEPTPQPSKPDEIKIVAPASELLDGLDRPVPKKLADAFDPHFEAVRQECLTHCRQLRDSLHAYAASAAGEQLRRRLSREGRTDDATRFRSKELQTLMSLIEHWAPYAAVCPYCAAKGKKPDCNVCYGTNWVCADAWQSAPQDYKDAILEPQEGGTE